MADRVWPGTHSSLPAGPGHRYSHTHIGPGGKAQLDDIINNFRELPQKSPFIK